MEVVTKNNLERLVILQFKCDYYKEILLRHLTGVKVISLLLRNNF